MFPRLVEGQDVGEYIGHVNCGGQVWYRGELEIQSKRRGKRYDAVFTIYYDEGGGELAEGGVEEFPWSKDDLSNDEPIIGHQSRIESEKCPF